MSDQSPTVTVAIDRHHLEELRVSLPTWVRNVDGFADFPFILIGDVESIDDNLSNDALLLANTCGVNNVTFRDVAAVLPAGFPSRHDVTQRERMLTALAFAPSMVTTPTYLKLDTDTVALPVRDKLLSAKVTGSRPIAAPRWGYTKPGHWLDTLDLWSDQTAPGNAKPYRVASGGVAKSQRIISYAMLGDTAFANRCLRMLTSPRLPVPSQDTFYWYCAMLLGREVSRFSTNEICWRHAGGNMRKLKKLAAESMG